MEFDCTTHPISWFTDQYQAGKLNIRPPYQRKPVWTAKQKCPLIESILLGLPVPEVFVQMTTTASGKATYAVVDGQQRIRTVLQFIGCDRDKEEEEHNKFRLDKFEGQSIWRGKAFEDLADDEKSKFYEYKFAVRYLKSTNDGEVRDMFTRLNKYLTPLNAQELRHATYTGPFCKLIEGLADNGYWIRNRFATAAKIRRMKDIEFVANLLIGVMHGPQGGSDDIVDGYYEQYDEYEDEFPDQKRMKELFNRTLATVQGLFPEIRESARWGNMTDFYTLFVALAMKLRTGHLPKSQVSNLRNELNRFAGSVDRRLADEHAQVKNPVIEYVRAVQKGANDKQRRGDRHSVLLSILDGFFKEKLSE